MIDRVARGTAALGNDDPATADEQLGPLVAAARSCGGP